MKQHTTPAQLDELSKKGKDRLWEKWEPKPWHLVLPISKEDAFVGTWAEYLSIHGKTFQEYEKIVKTKPCYPLLSIGQMIEFLMEEKEDLHIECLHESWEVSTCYDEKWEFKDKGKHKLVDVLWEATKEILEK